MPVSRHLAVHVDDPTVVLEKVSHETLYIVRNEPFLLVVCGQVEIDGIAVEHRVEVVDTDVTVPAVVGVLFLPLMPLARVTSVALPAAHRAVPLEVPTGKQSGLAGHFLKSSQPAQDLTAMLTRRRVMRYGILIPHAGEVASRPNAGMDDISCFINRVRWLGLGRRYRHDRDVETVQPMPVEQILPEVLRLLSKGTLIVDLRLHAPAFAVLA